MPIHLPIAEPKFILTSRAKAQGAEVFHSYTRVLCPTCKKLIDGARMIRDGKVFVRKQCPDHGQSEALLSGDAAWWLRSLTFLKPGSIPLEHSTEVHDGCPSDCGLCADHEQHSCLPIVEVSNHCNLECPICIVENKNNWQMSLEEFDSVLDGLIKKEGRVETLAISGGEPTIHPLFLQFLDLAIARKEIARVSISTHGLRCASDYGFCEELAKRGVYVSLQLDAVDNNPLKVLRGKGNHQAARERTLANLEKAGVRTTIVCTVAKGVNDRYLGDLVQMLFTKDFVLSLMFQPAAYVGFGGETFAEHDPMDTMTIPDVVKAVEQQSGGALLASDFLPLPCSHPSCFGLTYLLKTDEGWLPFPRFLDLDRYLQVITNKGTLSPDAELESAIRDTMDEMWTSAAQVPDSAVIMKSLKRAIQLMYPEERALELTERLRIGEGLVKTIFIHAFMDVHNFEIDRIKKCCTHYALPDGRLMPGCSYNNLYRGKDTRFGEDAGAAPPIWAEGE